MYIYTYYFFSLLFVFLSLYIVLISLLYIEGALCNFLYIHKRSIFACGKIAAALFVFRFSLHLSNVGQRDCLHCQLLPFVCSRDRVFRTFCRTFCRVFMFALPLRPTFAKRLQGSFHTVLRRFQAFLFAGYTFAYFRAFRFIVCAQNSLICPFASPLHPCPWGGYP